MGTARSHFRPQTLDIVPTVRYRVTVVSDPKLMDIVFHPGIYGENETVGDAIKVEMAKLAHAWFGIPKDIGESTRPGLDAVRKTLSPYNVQPFADKVGAGLVELFASYPSEGEMDLFEVASGTFWPVNQAMFGAATINKANHADAQSWFHGFDADLPKLTQGYPRSMFPKHEENAAKIVTMFADSVKAGNHRDAASCPVLANRLQAVKPGPDSFSPESQGRFMLSIFWAAQANTLPMTFWLLAEILRHPRCLAAATKEARGARFVQNAPDKNGKFDCGNEALPYIRACLKEVLRMKVAILTHRKVSRDVAITDSNGKTFKLPRGDMVTVASYLKHYDEGIYPNPQEFRPERWLNADGSFDGYTPDDKWFPFSQGRYSCSGKHLAQLEIPLLAALFFRFFDAEIVGGAAAVPEANWDEVLAAVLPKGSCQVRFKKVSGV